jgi:hypothetical protein
VWNTKLGIDPKELAAQPGAGSTGRASQPREPAAVAGPAITAKKSSEDQDIKKGQIAPLNGTVDLKQENVSSSKIGTSSGAVYPGAIVVQPGTITPQSAERSAYPARTMHTGSPDFVTSKAVVANRTAHAASSGSPDF